MKPIQYGHDDLPTCIVCGHRITTAKYNAEFCSLKCKNILVYQNNDSFREVEVLMRQYRNGGIKE